MKKKFIAKGKKKKIPIIKWLAFSMVVLLSCFFTIRFLAHFTINTSQEDFLRYMLENQNVFVKNSKTSYSYFHQIMTKLIDLDLGNPLSILHSNYTGMTSSDDIQTSKVDTKPLKDPKPNKVKDPVVYIYNTHQTEDYRPTSFAEYNVTPNVMMTNYILKEQLQKSGIDVIVEEESVADMRKLLGLNYAGSYQVTKSFMEKAKRDYPSLEYFIDMHRDSIGYDKTTLTKDNVTYAKILFIVGLEHENYEQNLEFTNQIHTLLNQKVEGISKGIYQKEGAGVNGIYNQDFSPHTILVELGGVENTIDEVYRSVLVLSDVLSEVMNF